jgi:hypothetical protein
MNYQATKQSPPPPPPPLPLQLAPVVRHLNINLLYNDLQMCIAQFVLLTPLCTICMPHTPLHNLYSSHPLHHVQHSAAQQASTRVEHQHVGASVGLNMGRHVWGLAC